MIQFTVLFSPALAYVLSIPRLRHFIPIPTFYLNPVH